MKSWLLFHCSFILSSSSINGGNPSEPLKAAVDIEHDCIQQTNMALNQLRLLLWKNLLSQTRRPKQVACIIIIPLICLALLAFVSLQFSNAKRFTEHGENKLDPFSPDSLDSQLLSVVAGEEYDLLAGLKKKAVLKVYYTPNNTVTRSLLESVAKKLDVKIKGKILS